MQAQVMIVFGKPFMSNLVIIHYFAKPKLLTPSICNVPDKRGREGIKV
jgi:hypothetical protein